MAREGDPLQVAAGDFRTVAEIDFVGGKGDAWNRLTGLNDVGQVTFSARFTDGTSGLFIAHLPIPEPRTWLLILTGVPLMVRDELNLDLKLQCELSLLDPGTESFEQRDNHRPRAEWLACPRLISMAENQSEAAMAFLGNQHVPVYLRVQVVRMCQNLVTHGWFARSSRILRALVQNVVERRPEIDDILRSAVVLLHASLEDLLRSIASKHISRSESAFLARIPLAGMDRATKFTLADLSAHQGKQVDEVLNESIDQWLHQHSFNSGEDIVSMLKDIGIPPDCWQDTFLRDPTK